MILVVILGVLSSVGVGYVSPGRGDLAPSFARGLLAMTNDVRQANLSRQRASRIRIVKGPPTQIIAELDDGAGGWQTLTTINPPGGVDLCDVRGGTSLGATPTGVCPLGGDHQIVFASAAAECGPYRACLDGAGSNGVTFYFQTTDGKYQYRLLVFGLTGLPKLIAP